MHIILGEQNATFKVKGQKVTMQFDFRVKGMYEPCITRGDYRNYA